MTGVSTPKAVQDCPEQRIIYPLLFVCMLTMILLQAFSNVEWLTRIFYTVVITGAVIQVRKRRLLLTVGIIITVTATLTGSFEMFQADSEQLSPMVTLSYLAAFVFTACIILLTVISHHKVTRATVSGALCVFLLMGICWTLAYSLLERNIERRDSPFNGINKAQVYRDTAKILLQQGLIEGSEGFDADLEALITYDTQDENAPKSALPDIATSLIRRESYNYISHQLFYFSYVTLTTLGYGDISPRSEKARSLTMLEAICGQMFLAVFIARLVGLHIATQTSRRSAEEP